MKKKTKLIIVAVVVVIAVIVGSLGAYFGYFKPHKEAVAAYNVVVSDIQEKNDQLDGEIKKLQELVDNEDKPLDETTIDTAKEALKNAGASKIVIGEMPKATKDILSRTKELSTPVDYSDELTSLSTAYTNLENSKKQYKQVVNPSEEFVMQRILTVDDVADARAVTEDQDPNGNLYKAGGYTSTIYFESKTVNQSDVYVSGEYADVLIDKGTDAGGAIEVYENVEDAEKRRDYLATFDGTIFANGTHTVIGTVLVRTSNELTATQQKELEQKVIDALTRLE
ncbi:hypothetical protein [Agathobaculum butyriciproducens]|uniref:hypothetical protein n=1 Tax=Agathobaculum butyriciproducens TaxID=1628085 RepID=UPI003AF07FAC